MRILFVVALALLLAGAAAAQSDNRPDPLDPQSKVPPVEFRSAFEGYRPFADQDLRDWRKANEEVGTAGGDAAGPGQGTGQQAPGTQPATPEGSGDHRRHMKGHK
jgi:hypothetical protein